MRFVDTSLPLHWPVLFSATSPLSTWRDLSEGRPRALRPRTSRSFLNYDAVVVCAIAADGGGAPRARKNEVGRAVCHAPGGQSQAGWRLRDGLERVSVVDAVGRGSIARIRAILRWLTVGVEGVMELEVVGRQATSSAGECQALRPERQTTGICVRGGTRTTTAPQTSTHNAAEANRFGLVRCSHTRQENLSSQCRY